MTKDKTVKLAPPVLDLKFGNNKKHNRYAEPKSESKSVKFQQYPTLCLNNINCDLSRTTPIQQYDLLTITGNVCYKQRYRTFQKD